MIINSAKELGSLVRSKRKKRGWSQRELAAEVGVSPLWVSNFERGKSTAHIGLVLRTLKALDVRLTAGERVSKDPEAQVVDLNELVSSLPRAAGTSSGRPLPKKNHE
ncbi:MAG: helix-turn-helix transcriptional regulator [Puniceicoccaceae bacterium]|nr:helix-turn-helix transcriptional regulator [Puniceicoccaceae bacterium]